MFALTFFMALSNTQHLDYQMMFYAFCGTLIFTMIFAMIYMVFVDRPIHAFFLFHHDLRTVTNNLNINPQSTVNIEHYKMQQEGDRTEFEDPMVSNLVEKQANNLSGDKSNTLFDFSGQASPKTFSRD
jgi:hypothetical protein